MTNNLPEKPIDSTQQNAVQGPSKVSTKKPKKELPYAFYGQMSEKGQKQFISRTTDLLMQDALFSELSPKPIPSRDQIMSQLSEYIVDSLKAK